MDDRKNTKKENKIKNSFLLANKDSIKLPKNIAKYLGIENASTPLRFAMNGNKLEIQANIHSLAKVYIEPTSKCNLNCQTCVRSTWNEKTGNMDSKVFDALINQLKDFKNIQSVMFGGFGEPTFHKDILLMINRIKSLDIQAEITTNGTMLNECMIKGLFKNKLDVLWISFDGTDQNIFEGIRRGASYNHVVENLKILKSFNRIKKHKIKVGITFVVMKKNIDSLSEIVNLAKTIGASSILISNVLPYSHDMVDQTLYNWSTSRFYSSNNSLSISLPLIDVNRYTKEPLYSLFKNYNFNISIIDNMINLENPKCRFIRERSTFIRWDGMVSPCMGLLHESKTYPYLSDNFERVVKSYTLGDINKRKLKEIWDSEEYRNFRNKVNDFDFSPCLQCGLCEYAENNSEDCFGNIFPTCGGCLWAQGVIQCP